MVFTKKTFRNPSHYLNISSGSRKWKVWKSLNPPPLGLPPPPPWYEKVTEKYHATMLTFSSGTIYYEAGFL